jgi:CheY-like chemotaxis protein/anti-sigma regulatory factor (Ser/Thr protein kinase)
MDKLQRERVRESINMIDEAVTASRSLTIELSPPILHDAGLPAAFEWLARWVKERHGLQVGVSCDPQADSEREDIRVLIFQATRELLFNVVKHAKVDRACVELSLHENDALKIVVRDRGVGFEPDPTNAAVDSSNGGFGLFSIAERVQSLGGRLDVESAPQQGTRVTLIVPIESLPSDADKGHATPDPESEVPSAPAIRVLLADDHKVMRQGLYSMLQNCDDMEVVGQASDGREAIELARRLQPDVILMDYRMAPIDGIEATRILHAEMPGARIIGLSMYESADRAAAMLSAGACAYVTKSGKAAELLETIRCVKPDRVPQP